MGPEGYVKERLAAFSAAGVTHINITPVPMGGQTQTDVVGMVKAWSDDV